MSAQGQAVYDLSNSVKPTVYTTSGGSIPITAPMYYGKATGFPPGRKVFSTSTKLFRQYLENYASMNNWSLTLKKCRTNFTRHAEPCTYTKSINLLLSTSPPLILALVWSLERISKEFSFEFLSGNQDLCFKVAILPFSTSG
jgi:hypothetical protein